MTFDWDDANRNHLRRHKVSAEEAEQVIRNAPYELDVQYKDGEERIRYIGETIAMRVLTVIITYRSHYVRVITAWDASAADKQDYLNERMADDGQAH